MSIDFKDLPPEVQFVYMAVTKSTIFLKRMGQNKSFFLNFCSEVWDSMELSDLDKLEEVLSQQMKEDLKPVVESYLKSQEKNGLDKR